MHNQLIITSNDIINAEHLIADYVHNTPILQSQQINQMLGCELFFKCENLQKVGAFKARGAMNALLTLSDEALQKGVCTHSSGNHAQAIARSAKILGIEAHIVMPNNSPQVKVDAVRNYGGNIYFCEPTLEAREKLLLEVQERTGAFFIHPFNNLQIITGQATVAKEIFDLKLDLDYLIAPVGGGGLLSGCALSAFYYSPQTKVTGAEPWLARDAQLSMQQGTVQTAFPPLTIADGLLTSLGNITFGIIQNHVDQILTCSEEQIIEAMQLIYERLKIVVEPSAAVPLAVVIENKELFLGTQIGIVLSGGNIDLSAFFDLLKNRINS
jgi:threonine dehydratase